jgi:hypothetical protein
MNKTIACPNGHPVQVPALPGRAFSGGVSVVTRSAEDEFLHCTLCGPFRQDGRGNTESIIDLIANREFHHELVAANRAVIEALTIDGETDVDMIVARSGIDEDMVRTVLANGDVFETSTFADAPRMIAAAKLTPYGTTLARIARNERTRRVPKNVPCPRCRKEHTILVIDEPAPSEKTSVGAVICNGCCGFTVDDYGRVYP